MSPWLLYSFLFVFFLLPVIEAPGPLAGLFKSKPAVPKSTPSSDGALPSSAPLPSPPKPSSTAVKQQKALDTAVSHKQKHQASISAGAKTKSYVGVKVNKVKASYHRKQMISNLKNADPTHPETKLLNGRETQNAMVLGEHALGTVSKTPSRFYANNKFKADQKELIAKQNAESLQIKDPTERTKLLNQQKVERDQFMDANSPVPKVERDEIKYLAKFTGPASSLSEIGQSQYIHGQRKRKI